MERVHGINVKAAGSKEYYGLTEASNQGHLAFFNYTEKYGIDDLAIVHLQGMKDWAEKIR
ncbi:hypothetical protein ABEY43_07045 [Priestia megaterium]